MRGDPKTPRGARAPGPRSRRRAAARKAVKPANARETNAEPLADGGPSVPFEDLPSRAQQPASTWPEFQVRAARQPRVTAPSGPHEASAQLRSTRRRRIVLLPRSRLQAWSAGGLVGAISVVALIAVIAALALPDSHQSSVRPSDEPQATATPSDEPQATATFLDRVAGSVSVFESFDGLPMDSSLADPWTIDGDGAVRVVALPTSVDRSIRIASDKSGGATSVCRRTGLPAGSGLRITLEYRLGRSLRRDASLLEFRAGGSVVSALVVDAATGGITGASASGTASSEAPTAGGSPGTAPEASTGPDADTAWRHIEVTVSDSGKLTWRANTVSGAESGSGSLQGGAGHIDTVCFSSPAGARAGWVAIDDLLIEG